LPSPLRGILLDSAHDDGHRRAVEFLKFVVSKPSRDQANHTNRDSMGGIVFQAHAGPFRFVSDVAAVPSTHGGEMFELGPARLPSHRSQNWFATVRRLAANSAEVFLNGFFADSDDAAADADSFVLDELGRDEPIDQTRVDPESVGCLLDGQLHGEHLLSSRTRIAGAVVEPLHPRQVGRIDANGAAAQTDAVGPEPLGLNKGVDGVLVNPD